MKIMMIIMMMAMTLKIMKTTMTTLMATVDDSSVNGNNDYDDNIQNNNVNK